MQTSPWKITGWEISTPITDGDDAATEITLTLRRPGPATDPPAGDAVSAGDAAAEAERQLAAIETSIGPQLDALALAHARIDRPQPAAAE